MPDSVVVWILSACALALFTAVSGWIWLARHRSPDRRGDEAHFRASVAGLVAFSLLTGIIGIGASLVGGRVLLQQAQSARWSAAEGVITQTDVQPRHLSGRMPGVTRWEPTVEYSYTVAGRTYTGDRIAFHAPTGATTPDAAEREIAAYAEGTEVAVYYDPQRPESAVLDRRAGAEAYVLTLGGVFLLVSHLIGLGIGPHITYPPFLYPPVGPL